MRSYVVIIPVREFTNTKLRLSSVLSSSQRAALTLALLRKVLFEVERSSAVGAIVVATSPDSVAKHTRDFPKTTVIKESNRNGGVDSAMRDGLETASDKYSASSAVLIPSDLPLLSFRALDKVGLLLEKYDLVINPSSKLDGTSLLAFNLESERIPFHYEDNSFYKHLAEARKMKIKHRIIKLREFSFDVDTTRDFKQSMETFGAESLREFLLMLERSGAT